MITTHLHVSQQVNSKMTLQHMIQENADFKITSEPGIHLSLADEEETEWEFQLLQPD